MDIKEILKQKINDYIDNKDIKDSVFMNLPKEASLTFFNDDFLFELFLNAFLLEDDDVVISVIGKDLFFSDEFYQLKLSIQENYKFFN